MNQSLGQTYHAEMISFASANFEYWQTLVLPIKERRDQLLEEQDPIFRQDIEKQYVDRIKHVLLCDLCIRLRGIPTDTALMFIEQINLKGL